MSIEPSQPESFSEAKNLEFPNPEASIVQDFVIMPASNPEPPSETNTLIWQFVKQYIPSGQSILLRAERQVGAEKPSQHVLEIFVNSTDLCFQHALLWKVDLSLQRYITVTRDVTALSLAAENIVFLATLALEIDQYEQLITLARSYEMDAPTKDNLALLQAFIKAHTPMPTFIQPTSDIGDTTDITSIIG